MKKVIITVMLALISLTVSCGADKSEKKNETATVESTDNNNDKVSESADDNSKDLTTDKDKVESTSATESSTTTNKNSSIKTGNKQIYKDKLDKIKEGIKNDLEASYNGPNQTAIAAAREEYSRWDKTLNEIYNELKTELPKNDMSKLEQEEKNWIGEKEEKAKKASEEMKGGTGEQLLYNGSLAATTRERCYELVEKYMK